MPKENFYFEEIEDDDIDLVDLVSKNANSANQFVIFEGSDNQYYGFNVSKIEELVVYKDLEIAKSHKDSFIIGTANVRGDMVTLVNFDKWIGNKVLDDKDYELVILADYAGHKLGIVVKKVEQIVNLASKEMREVHDDERISFVTTITINKKERICSIFDSDKLILDTFGVEVDSEMLKRLKKLDKDKMILFADDSKFIRKMVEDVFKKLDVKYKIYEDGKALYDDLKNLDVSEIGLILTDLEMPRMGGIELIKKLREDKRFDNIDILVQTNMATKALRETLSDIKADDVIDKINMQLLSDKIKEHMK